mgnify:CR=1 FL=1
MLNTTDMAKLTKDEVSMAEDREKSSTKMTKPTKEKTGLIEVVC